MAGISDIKKNSVLEINNALKQGHIWVEELGVEYLHDFRPANCSCYGDLSPQEEEIYFAAHIGGCLNAEQEVNAFKDQILGLIRQKKLVFDNYKNEVITQTERELRERLSPHNTEVIERLNWREKLRSCQKREEITQLKENLLNLAAEAKRIKDEHEEWKRNFQAERQENQTERENRQRELEERERAAEDTAQAAAETFRNDWEQRARDRETEEENWRRWTEETISKAEEKACKENDEQFQEQKNKKQVSQEGEVEQKEKQNKKVSKKDDETDKLSQECQDHLNKTDEYLKSLDLSKKGVNSSSKYCTETCQAGQQVKPPSPHLANTSGVVNGENNSIQELWQDVKVLQSQVGFLEVQKRDQPVSNSKELEDLVGRTLEKLEKKIASLDDKKENQSGLISVELKNLKRELAILQSRQAELKKKNQTQQQVEEEQKKITMQKLLVLGGLAILVGGVVFLVYLLFRKKQ
jgi:hypothetical protein